MFIYSHPPPPKLVAMETILFVAFFFTQIQAHLLIVVEFYGKT